MDLIKTAMTEYEYYKLAKRIEIFAFRCHFFEVSINRIIKLIHVMNGKLEESSEGDRGEKS